MNRHFSTPDEAFDARTEVGPNGCIEWTGAKNKNGYGSIKIAGKSTLAHRFSYGRSVGPVPDAMMVLHRCDIPACVNPDHLFVGSNQDNMDDMYAKGRGRKASGSSHGRTRLTEADVFAIRADGRKLRDIAAAYGIGKSAVGYIKSGKNWAHI